MIKTNEIKAQMQRVGMTQSKLAEKMGINPSTLNRKINNEEGENLTVQEANKMILFLNLPKESITEIFFA